MKHILLLTTIITLSACAAHVDRVYDCPIQVGNKIIQGNCKDGNGFSSGILDGGSKPTDPEDNPKDDDNEVEPDHPTKPDVKPEPPKDKPKEEPKKDKDHGHSKGHFSGGFGKWEGEGRKDHKDW